MIIVTSGEGIRIVLWLISSTAGCLLGSHKAEIIHVDPPRLTRSGKNYTGISLTLCKDRNRRPSIDSKIVSFSPDIRVRILEAIDRSVMGYYSVLIIAQVHPVVVGVLDIRTDRIRRPLVAR